MRAGNQNPFFENDTSKVQDWVKMTYFDFDLDPFQVR